MHILGEINAPVLRREQRRDGGSARRLYSLRRSEPRGTRSSLILRRSLAKNMDKFRLPCETGSRLRGATWRHKEVLYLRETLARVLRVHEAVLIHQ